MKTRVLLLLPLAAACTFPDVLLGGGDGGAPGSSSTNTSTTSTTASGDPGSTGTANSTASSSSGGGDGGAGTSTGSSGGSTSDGGGGSTSDGGGGAGGSSGPGGLGFCPPGSVDANGVDIEDCQYETVVAPAGAGGAGGGGGAGGSVPFEDRDCDADGTRNADDCHACNPEVPWDQGDDVYTTDSYIDLDENESWDWNCKNGTQKEHTYLSRTCPVANPLTGSCVALMHYAESKACGEPVGLVTCTKPALGSCQVASEEQSAVACN